ncbi:MAG TPA: FAD-binding protein [Steroidobacteraceae bacterium]|jgi:FAD/FMN-containing dehydrogenase
MTDDRTFSRRGFAQAVAGGSLIAGFDALTGSWVAAADAHGTPFASLPHLDGELSFDPSTRQDYAKDYGQIVHEQPLAVLRPGSVEDISRMVGFARRFGLKIAARGEGHQPFGQAQVCGGIVIDMRSLQQVHTFTADSVEVDAGASWRSVLQATLSYGLAPPVLTKFLGLTVGGTLSIGGVGVASMRHGAQADQTLALQVVTGEGDVVVCSEQQRRDLFEAALAGQGQCAVITRATLRLECAPRQVREYTLPYADLQTLVEDATRVTLEGRFDAAVALIMPIEGGAKYALTPVKYLTSPDLPDDAALLRSLRFIPGSAQIRDVDYFAYLDEMPPIDFTQSHADLGLMMAQQEATAFIGNALPRLTPDDLGGVQGIRLFFWKRTSFRRPLLRLPVEQLVCYAALLRTPTNDSDLLARTLAGNRTLYDLNRDGGGTLYPFAAVELTREDWRRQYGAQWHTLEHAKRRYDPDAVFASGPNLYFT